MRHKYYDVIVAWAEGKEIQYRHKHHYKSGKWIIVKPENFSNSPNFSNDDVEWRIKPEIKTLKYRVALVHQFKDKNIKELEFYIPEDMVQEPDSNFIRWVTDWVEVEI